MAEENLEQEEAVSGKKKKFGLVTILIYVAIILVGIIVMVVVSNIVFNMRNTKEHQIEQEIWAPATELKAAPLTTFPIESLQINLSDPTGSTPSFVKVTMALAYEDKGAAAESGGGHGGGHGGGGGEATTPMAEELTKRSSEIRDKIISIISARSYEDLDSTDKQASLKKEIMNQINTLLIHGVIQGVYITDFNLVKTRY